MDNNSYTANKFSANLITVLGLLIGMSLMAAYFVHFPILPMVPFLKYDPADIPILIGGFMFGPAVGVLLTVGSSIIQGLTFSAGGGAYGVFMHIIATSALVYTASLIYNRNKTRKSAAIGLFCGCLAMTGIMIPANYIITPLFLGVDASKITPIIGYIVLFNVLKSGINATITFLIYKKISALYKG